MFFDLVKIPGFEDVDLPDPSHPFRISRFYPNMPCIILGFHQSKMVPVFRATVSCPAYRAVLPDKHVPCTLQECLLNEEDQKVFFVFLCFGLCPFAMFVCCSQLYCLLNRKYSFVYDRFWLKVMSTVLQDG